MGLRIRRARSRGTVANTPSDYSSDYCQLTTSAAQITALMAGSCVLTDTDDAAEALSAWERSRRFIASAITAPGAVLDYGSGNGFLLRSLQEWCPFDLVPYGVEIDESRLHSAKELFGCCRDHFCDPESISQMTTAIGFDFVYWSVGDNLDFADPGNLRWLRTIAALTSGDGRMIVGLYGTKQQNRTKLNDIDRAGFALSEVVRNPHGVETIAWTDNIDESIDGLVAKSPL